MVNDYGNIPLVDTIAVSKFKSSCLHLLAKVQKTGQPLLVTKKGNPLALVTPPPPTTVKKFPLGVLQGSVKITGDIVKPLPLDDWEVYRDEIST